MNTILNTTAATLLTFASLALVSCSMNNVDMPKGTSKNYTSARLVTRNPNLSGGTSEIENRVHGMIQKSISGNFNSKGLAYGKGKADLTVAYMVIYQEPGMTATYEDYFGYGRSSVAISDLAHTRGVIDNKRPDYFKRAGIVIDVIDSSTNELVYRNFAAGDIVESGASNSARQARIDSLVGEALAQFFR